MNGHQSLTRVHDRPARQITITSFEPEPAPLRPGLRGSGGCRWPYALVRAPRVHEIDGVEPTLPSSPLPPPTGWSSSRPDWSASTRSTSTTPAARRARCTRRCWRLASRSWSTWAGLTSSRQAASGSTPPQVAGMGAVPVYATPSWPMSRSAARSRAGRAAWPSRWCGRASATFAPGAGRSASGRRRSSRPCWSRYLLTLPQLVWNK
jgi:hypothetical protein